MLDWVDIVIIVTIVILLFLAIRTESYDLTCPEGPNTVDMSVCREGNGKAYNDAIPQDSDDRYESRERIIRGARSITTHVRWRMIFIASTILAGLITALILPAWNWRLLFLILILSFVVMYGVSNFVDYHHYNYVRDYINANAVKL